jgi:hypothetical protein
MQVIETKSKREKVRRVKKLMESVGDNFGSVWFYKRSDGALRKMCYRLHVTNPSCAPKPTGNKFLYKKAMDSEKDLLTVFDTNLVRRNNKGKMCGRGGYKSVGLDNVIRLKVGGTIYRFI